MKFLFSILFVISSITCFSQQNQDSLQKVYLAKAQKAPEYKQAVTNITEVRKKIALSKKGLLRGADVVKDYNLRLGKGMGEKQTFKEVDARVTEAGDEFIKYMLLKAAARLATEDAAKTTN